MNKGSGEKKAAYPGDLGKLTKTFLRFKKTLYVVNLSFSF